ncbi:MAG: 2Fe-2S iron-sulfur cluster binding domain-containing protein [Alphaproteobacteria bacterium]|nr:2Fe-2S iron-sulfur cluster binding domain-containing protein [Alphaproteobacteria bacterium]
MIATVRLADGSVAFPCAAGDNLLHAGLRAGIGLPYECSVGSCGTCKYELLDGRVETLWAEAPGLGERDRRKGRRLACQSRPLTDCTINLRPGAAYVLPVPAARQRVAFLASEPVTHDMREFRFRAAAPARFVPGQYALLELPGVGARRAYSMCNLANAEGDWHFHIRAVPGGRASRILFGPLDERTEVVLDGPFGLAYLREGPRDIVCVAGGSGLSPMVAIARGFAAGKGHPARRLHFFFGGRTPADICGESLLAVLPGYGERLTYHAAVSDPEAARAAGWPGPTGFVHTLVEAALAPNLARFEFYFAGPPPMAEAMQRMLVANSVPSAQVHFDRFF